MIHQRTVFDAESRRGQALLWGLLAVVVILTIAVVLMWMRRGPATPRLEEGQTVCDDFLRQIRDKHASQAWQSTTAEFKSAMGRERFLKLVKEHTYLTKPMGFVAAQTVLVNNTPRAEYRYRSDKGQVRLLAGNENGVWRVDRVIVE